MIMDGKAPKFHRKHYFIDRKFQGRYMMTFFIPMIIMLVFMLGTLYFAAWSIVDTTTRMLSRDVENTVALELQDQTSPSPERYKTTIADVMGRIKNFSQSKELKREMLSTLLVVFGIGIFLVIIQIVFLTIFFSHKVAGPVYRFERVLHSLIEGRYTDAIHLRKGDEMQNMAGLFNLAIQHTRQRLHDLVHAETEEQRRETASKLQL
jgi:nitrate/nitrite-specific signal transduction histidine kinase